ncbi:hypothetical protein G195_004025 [Phytophthora kernoviae 00238/432]|uniref:Uncharacterized protein n=2 Tax=Phytophthora kernoviae TaxID=325452 RepID=A0A8T0MCA9_9STRA|nr:hypothetical protein G195_004025 [Phytophthora kernoviae 00238/432]KAG2532434.1 hypothetical protein JM16_000378 [Phytophthora kernoviae]
MAESDSDGEFERSSADPYAFDMTASAFPLPSKTEEEESNAKKKKKEQNVVVKKVPVKSTLLSMEDRITEILKRTGSAQLQASEEEESEEELDSKIDEVNKEQVGAAHVRNDEGGAQSTNKGGQGKEKGAAIG